MIFIIKFCFFIIKKDIDEIYLNEKFIQDFFVKSYKDLQKIWTYKITVLVKDN